MEKFYFVVVDAGSSRYVLTNWLAERNHYSLTLLDCDYDV